MRKHTIEFNINTLDFNMRKNTIEFNMRKNTLDFNMRKNTIEFNMDIIKHYVCGIYKIM